MADSGHPESATEAGSNAGELANLPPSGGADSRSQPRASWGLGQSLATLLGAAERAQTPSRVPGAPEGPVKIEAHVRAGDLVIRQETGSNKVLFAPFEAAGSSFSPLVLLPLKSRTGPLG